MADFDSWAIYYDLIHKGLPGEAEFYVGHAVKHGGPALEVGCGTGRIAIPMAMSGLDVTGLDNSAPMLSVCREKLAQVSPVPGKLKLVQADMRDFTLERQFPLALMTYRTFMHCLTPEEQLACLKCIHLHLEPGGELLCNLWAARPGTLVKFPPEFDEKAYQLAGTTHIPGEDLTLVHMHNAWRDDHRQLLHERHWLQEKDLRGKIVHEEHLTMTRAWVTPREMEHLVARVGFDVVAVLGNFDGERLGPDHMEMVWHLRKKTDYT